MGKITVDLAIMSDHALSFDQYMVLYHLHTGEFEEAENKWLMFDEAVFEERFCPLKKPGVLPVLLSLKHRKFIDFKSDGSFRIVNKSLFNKVKASKKIAAPILSFREEDESDKYLKRSQILNSCTNLENWKSEKFVRAWNVFEYDVRTDKTIKKPLTASSAGRLAQALIRLSGNDEAIATKIIEQSNENTWRGFWPLGREASMERQDRKKMVEHWYPES